MEAGSQSSTNSDNLAPVLLQAESRDEDSLLDELIADVSPALAEAPGGGAMKENNSSSDQNDQMELLPTQAQLLKAWIPRMHEHGAIYQKSVKMHARCETKDAVIETTVAGMLETVNVSKAGDYTIEGTEGERYTMGAAAFLERYDVEHVELAATHFAMFRSYAAPFLDLPCRCYVAGLAAAQHLGRPSSSLAAICRKHRSIRVSCGAAAGCRLEMGE